jgi:hypothetical protein
VTINLREENARQLNTLKEIGESDQPFRLCILGWASEEDCAP